MSSFIYLPIVLIASLILLVVILAGWFGKASGSKKTSDERPVVRSKENDRYSGRRAGSHHCDDG